MGDMGAKKRMSFEEFELLYDDTGELELLSGELSGPLGSAALPFPDPRCTERCTRAPRTPCTEVSLSIRSGSRGFTVSASISGRKPATW